MKKLNILNRKGQNVSVLLEQSSEQQGLAFVMHGLGGFKEQPHIATFAEAFKESGFSVVRFDTTNSFGESDGHYEDATLTNYYEDLEDVITWASTQSWYQEPFVLCGHSLGGICSALFAEMHPEKVLALAPISTVVSGALSLRAHKESDPDEIAAWETTGWKQSESVSRPGVIKRLPWSHMLDRLKYDLIPDAAKLSMPVVLITGSEDDVTPPKHTQLLYDILPGPKEIHLVNGAPHTFRTPKHLSEIKEILIAWIKSFR